MLCNISIYEGNVYLWLKLIVFFKMENVIESFKYVNLFFLKEVKNVYIYILYIYKCIYIYFDICGYG